MYKLYGAPRLQESHIIFTMSWTQFWSLNLEKVDDVELPRASPPHPQPPIVIPLMSSFVNILDSIVLHIYTHLKRQKTTCSHPPRPI